MQYLKKKTSILGEFRGRIEISSLFCRKFAAVEKLQLPAFTFSTHDAAGEKIYAIAETAYSLIFKFQNGNKKMSRL